MRFARSLCFALVVATGCGGEATRDSPGSGGSPAGGASPLGGAPGSGGGTAQSECQTADDCQLAGDCCTCEAVPRGTDSPVHCELDCIQDACSARNARADRVACVAGRCVIGYECTAPVTCPGLPGNCSPGQVPSVIDGCWGPCVPATECASVVACDACDPATSVCLEQTIWASERHCVALPQRCLNDRSCACLDPICPEFAECSEPDANRIACSCPAC